WMVERGARHLVLVGRRGLPERSLWASLSGQEETLRLRVAAVQELEALGAEVEIIQADVSDSERMAVVFEQLRNNGKPLRGVIHAAGVLDDGVLTQQSWERFENVMAAKVQGGWNLHHLTLDFPLDFFVLFSSAAALLGSPGQGNHAAANAFLDALAHYRR